MSIVENFKEEYRDIDISFRRNPINGDVVSLDTEQSIAQSLKNLVQIDFYEKHFIPTLGNYSAGSLFELVSADLVSGIDSSIRELVEKYEPRVKLEGVIVSEVDQIDGNFLSVTVVYYIIGRLKEYRTQILLQRQR